MERPSFRKKPPLVPEPGQRVRLRTRRGTLEGKLQGGLLPLHRRWAGGGGPDRRRAGVPQGRQGGVRCVRRPLARPPDRACIDLGGGRARHAGAPSQSEAACGGLRGFWRLILGG
jgi:hypothetical protein